MKKIGFPKVRFIVPVALMILFFICTPANGEVPTFTNAHDAAAYIRESIIARREDCEFLIFSEKTRNPVAREEISGIHYFDDELYGWECATAYNLFQLAAAHTGDPKGGDYLAFQAFSDTTKLEVSPCEGGYLLDIAYDFVYDDTAEQEAYVDHRLAELMPSLGLTGDEYDDVKKIYDYICLNVVYDYEHVTDEAYTLRNTAYGGLHDGTATCNGYGVLFYRMCLEAGIDARIIGGTALAGTITGGHTWNIVKINGQWYNVDATWDASRSSEGSVVYEYFLKSDCDFATHFPDEGYTEESFRQAYPKGEESLPYPGIVTASGEWGEEGSNIVWELQDDGTLLLTGHGSMGTDAGPPWKPYLNGVRHIVISEGITTVSPFAFSQATDAITLSLPNTLTKIGVCAFSFCSKLRTLELPDNVVDIQYGAFLDCYLLKEVHIGSGLKEIPESCFNTCTKLTQVAIPENVERIGDRAFEWCLSLEDIELPSSLRAVGTGVFNHTQIKEFLITASMCELSGGCLMGSDFDVVLLDERNPYYKIVDGVLFSKDGTKLISYNEKKRDTAYTVPDGTVVIDDHAFDGAWNLTNIRLPLSLRSLGNYALSGTNIMKCQLPEGLETIGNSAFSSCFRLSSIDIPDSVVSVGEYLFENCMSLRNAKLPQLCDRIPQGCFKGTHIETLILPEHVSAIGACAFTDCNHLKYVRLHDRIQQIDWNAFAFCPSLETFVAGEGLQKIGANAFSECTSLTTVQLNRDASIIDPSAFFGYDGVLPAELTCYVYAGTYAEQYCLDNGVECIVLCDEHVPVFDEAVSPSCTQEGRTEGTHCEKCGCILSGNEILPIQHEIEIIPAVLPDCMGHGRTSGQRCSLCGEILIQPALLEDTEHLWEEMPEVDSNCLTTGTKRYRYCAMCGWIPETPETIPVKRVHHIDQNGLCRYCGVNFIPAKENTLRLPGGLLEIGEESFIGITAERVIVPEGCQRVNDRAFAGCERIEMVYLPEGSETSFEGVFMAYDPIIVYYEESTFR